MPNDKDHAPTTNLPEAELAALRSVMGTAAGGWKTSATPAHEVHDGRFLFFSGTDAVDMNMALVHGADEAEAEAALEAAEKLGKPVLVMLAGAAKEAHAARCGAAGFTKVGTYPFMRVDLQQQGAAAARDPRVRRAVAGDRDAVVKALCVSFGLATEVGEAAVDPSVLGVDGAPGTTDTWVLEADGAIVSVVQTAVVGDLATVWCMGTPPDRQRKGYGKALLADVMARMLEGGCAYGLLGATAAGLPLYLRLGWTTLEEWDLLVKLPPQAEAEADDAA